jgi:hypothetical protein
MFIHIYILIVHVHREYFGKYVPPPPGEMAADVLYEKKYSNREEKKEENMNKKGGKTKGKRKTENKRVNKQKGQN